MERARRVAASHKAAHLVGVNQFFIDLITAARPQPGTELRRWWSEQHATDVYALADIRPDGHGIWHAEDRTVGFFVEHDNGTENLARVIAKLRGYERLAAFGPRYPVLLWVPSRDRETNLLRVLVGIATAMPIATAVHGPDPGHRRWLHELPSDHGPHAAINPSRYLDDDTPRTSSEKRLLAHAQHRSPPMQRPVPTPALPPARCGDGRRARPPHPAGATTTT